MRKLTTEDILTAFDAGEIDGEAWQKLSVDEGQVLVVDAMNQLEQSGVPISGYKVGLTSGAARDAFGAGVRPFGFIRADRVFESGETVPAGSISRPGLENEIAFRMARDPGPEADSAAARNAVEAIAPAFEINEDRVRGRGSPGLRVAENLSQWGLVVGTWLPADTIFETTSLDGLEVRASLDDQTIEIVDGAGHIDDHFASIATLSRSLHRAGLALSSGTIVITGSYTRFPVTSAGRYDGEFGPIGSVSVHIG